jgi:hypothetical protein
MTIAMTKDQVGKLPVVSGDDAMDTVGDGSSFEQQSLNSEPVMLKSFIK